MLDEDELRELYLADKAYKQREHRANMDAFAKRDQEPEPYPEQEYRNPNQPRHSSTATAALATVPRTGCHWLTASTTRLLPHQHQGRPPMAKHYPLDIENCGEDTYILRSKGHHDVHEFMRQVRADGYTWPLGMPQHLWCKTTPAPADSGFRCLYAIVPEGTRGAYPVTYVQEAYNEDAYEAIVAKEAGNG